VAVQHLREHHSRRRIRRRFPRDAEHGHADGCAQLAVAIADWDAATSQDT
jgi:hypothetical protein